MLNKIYKASLFAAIIALPLITYGASGGQLGGTTQFFQQAKILVQTILSPLVFTLALLLFFWGLVKYIWSTGTEKEQGKSIMIWGVIALFVMTSIWGITTFLGQELGVTPVTNMTIPTINGGSQ